MFFILIGTHNLIILFISTISIIEVIMSVAAWMNMLGWSFGLQEVLTAFMVNGFALDQVIRLTIEYKIAPFSSRNDRMKFAFTTLGTSVFTSALLTLAVSFPLLFCEMLFLKKCSIIVLAT
jgi:hypothetical protein